MNVFPDLEALVPHRSKSLLIESIVRHDTTSIVCKLTVPAFEIPNAPAPHSSTIPGIEYMAQACAAFCGLALHNQSKSVLNGFLLSVRESQILVPYFVVGEKLYAHAKIFESSSQISVFDCSLSRIIDSESVMTATISIFHPTEQ